jgi:hypothetical protein
MSNQLLFPSQPIIQTNFSLYLKVREVKKIALYLRQLNLQPLKKRKIWIKENQELVDKLLDSFTNDSLKALEGIALDNEESLKLSMDLMTSLRETVNMVNNLSVKQKHLRS